MTTSAQEYVIPDRLSPRTFKDALKDRRRFMVEDGGQALRGFFDSFDARLYRTGVVLEERWNGEEHELVLLDLGSGEPHEHQPIDTHIGFARDLPPGTFRERLEKVLSARRLLPLFALDTRYQTLRLLDDDGQRTIARVVIEENTFNNGSNKENGRLKARVRLLPIDRNERQARRAALFLEGEIGLEPATYPLFQEALDLSGKRPQGYSTKIDHQLDPDAPIEDSLKQILTALLATLEANIEGAKSNIDPEFLHDLRVATRRTRSAIGQIKGVLPAESLGIFKERFAWVQNVTGPVRDLDVYLLGFDDYRAALPEAMQADLEPMREYLEAHYDETQAAMARELDSAAFRGLIAEWHELLNTPWGDGGADEGVTEDTKSVADRSIWRLVKRVRKEARAIGPDSPPEALHELRKSCKKLRYLMEFFQSLYPKDTMRGLIKQVKALLDNLGEYQDLTVQAAHLGDLAEEMRAADAAPTPTLLAMGALVAGLRGRQAVAREHFKKLFEAFDKHDQRVRCRALFRPAEHHKAA